MYVSGFLWNIPLVAHTVASMVLSVEGIGQLTTQNIVQHMVHLLTVKNYIECAISIVFTLVHFCAFQYHM